ncbi:MAG TPA: zf-HC2 domain-containing protein [Terracidiphilus sp.]|nr:zf-HC2 domain-containing protein [Terracidiphilus sp.]
MAERAHIPSSPACGRWETLLADALDGLLSAADEIAFREHMAGCRACSALYEEARRGRQWLEFLLPGPEVPEGLAEQILARTGPGKTPHGLLTASGPAAVPAAVFTPDWQRPGFMGFIHRFAEPRLMMTAAMAFFSLALTLNLAGIRLSRMRLSDLRPAALRAYMERRITMASVPVIRYYDHLVFIYELQTRMHELRGEDEESRPQANPQSGLQPAAPGEPERNRKDGGSRVSPSGLAPRQQPGQPAQAKGDAFGEKLEASDHPAAPEDPDASGDVEGSSAGSRAAAENVLASEISTIRRPGPEGGHEGYVCSGVFLARLDSFEPRPAPAASSSAVCSIRHSTRAFLRLRNRKTAIQEGSGGPWTALITRA